jgi:glutathione S-transferase
MTMSDKPILHGVNASPFVRKARIALAEKGIDYELVPVMPMGQSAEYMKKSPLGKIPCWEEGDYILPDSSCIIAYLERTHPDPALYPSDPKQFGRALWYEEYADTKLTEAVTTAFFNRIVKKMMNQEPDEPAVAASLVAAEPVFDYLDGEIADREVLVGSHFSVADIAVCSPFVNFAHAGESVDGSRWPQLVAYLARHLARPSFKSVIEEEKAALGTR